MKTMSVILLQNPCACASWCNISLHNHIVSSVSFSSPPLPHSGWIKFMKWLILQYFSLDILQAPLDFIFLCLFWSLLWGNILYIHGILHYKWVEWVISSLLERWRRGSTIKLCKILNRMERVNKNLLLTVSSDSRARGSPLKPVRARLKSNKRRWFTMQQPEAVWNLLLCKWCCRWSRWDGFRERHLEEGSIENH